MAPHSGILRPLSKAHFHRARLDTLRSPFTLAHGPDYAQQPAARTIDDRRRPSDVRRLLDTHTLPPTNQDRAADQSAITETFWKRPAHFLALYKATISPISSVVSDPGPGPNCVLSPSFHLVSPNKGVPNGQWLGIFYKLAPLYFKTWENDLARSQPANLPGFRERAAQSLRIDF
uniref:Uncharacterized protein n=1 Tax=Caenorhabditis japonica TaxID=281687 RepID=A0A8R1EQY3_CAEJA